MTHAHVGDAGERVTVPLKPSLLSRGHLYRSSWRRDFKSQFLLTSRRNPFVYQVNSNRYAGLDLLWQAGIRVAIPSYIRSIQT